MHRLIGCKDRWPSRAANPYATHLPILVALGVIIPIRRVLEFGCGQFSTLAFLDRTVFPDLMQVDSYEDDPDWSQRMVNAISHDPRFRLQLVPHPVSTSAAQVLLEGYDLIFIDDSTCWQDRAATIRQVADRCSSSSHVVIHDYEVQPYREAAILFPHRFGFTALNPATGVAWKKDSINLVELKRMNSLIKRYSRLIEPDDLRRWATVLR